jgi:hypothetical protein
MGDNPDSPGATSNAILEIASSNSSIMGSW